MKPLVSVIVPVYKVENCLIHCLDSLCRQTLRDIEIILVDDASPDRCGAICDEDAAKDDRFKVVHHSENRGLSVARNTGIKEASASYLMFVDSDDYVHVDFCRLPYECAVSHDADLVLFHSKNVEMDGNVQKLNFNTKVNPHSKTKFEATDLLMNNVVGNVVWNKLYKKKLFDTISYPESYLYEDVGTTYKIIWQASSIYYFNKVLYFHCYREGSIVTLKTEKAMLDWIEMHMQKYHNLAAWGYSGENLEWKKRALFVLVKFCPALFDYICRLWGKKLFNGLGVSWKKRDK